MKNSDSVTETFVKAFIAINGRGLSPNRKAACEAALQAIASPGVLVKITFTEPSQIEETIEVLIHVLRKEKCFDETKTFKSAVKAFGDNRCYTIELTNGSGIVFDTERKERDK